jgi:hypothetical protein
VICEHRADEWCACIPRPPAHIGELVQKRGPGERIPAWSCRCTRPDGRPLLRNYRHTSEWDCIPQAEIDAWRVKAGCGPQTARHLYWLAKNFAPRKTYL